MTNNLIDGGILAQYLPTKMQNFYHETGTYQF